MYTLNYNLSTREITKTELTQFEIDELNRLESERLLAIPYTELRAAKYPSIQDQLDMQFHDKINGTNIWQDTIQAIKDSIPKV